MADPPAAERPLLSADFHVVMADVDMAHILYYATPLRWAERVLTRWRREIGLPVSAMLTSGKGSPVVETRITYARPLRMDDAVQARLWLDSRGRRAYTLRCDFHAGADGPIANQVWITQVPVELGENGSMRACDLPPEMAEALDRAA